MTKNDVLVTEVEPAPGSPAEEADGAARRDRGVTVRIQPKKVAAGAVAVALVAAVGIGAWQLHTTAGELDDARTDAALRGEAERVSLEYATGAAQMDFRDLPSWQQRLTEGLTPELTTRLEQAATSMEQIIVPLQWASTAQPIAAKAVAVGDGVYTVDCFVDVRTTNAQAPDGIQSTATYKLTLDSTDDWRITEITGVGEQIDEGATPK